MYPSKEELKGATEAYFKENHPEFYNNFSEVRWSLYFTVNIYSYVSFLF